MNKNMSNQVRLGERKISTIKKLGYAMNQIHYSIGETDEQRDKETMNAIKLVEQFNGRLTTVNVENFLKPQPKYSNENKGSTLFETKTSLFDGTGEAARAVQQRFGQRTDDDDMTR